MADDLSRVLRVPTPHLGVVDASVNPASRDYPATAAQVLRNLRISGGTLKTRYGHSTWHAVPLASESGFSGAIHGLLSAYQSDGTRHRLAVRGGKPYRLREDVDATWAQMKDPQNVAVTFGINPIRGEVLKDRLYFCDGSGPLYYYDLENQWVKEVAQPVHPGDALRVQRRTAGTLEDWSSHPAGDWDPESDTEIDFNEDSDEKWPTPPVPGARNRVRLEWKTSGSDGDQISKAYSPAVDLASAYIAFAVYQTDDNGNYVTFRAGEGSSDNSIQASAGISPARANNWEPVFVPVGTLDTISYVEWLIEQDATENAASGVQYLLISRLLLPGRLEGEYRWVATHYDPDTGAESKPSAKHNSGKPLDFTVQYAKDGNRDGYRKVAFLAVSTDVTTDSSTTKVRYYRNGGTASVVKDSQGRDVWLLLGDTWDFRGTVTGQTTNSVDLNELYGALDGSLTWSNTLAAGDWVCLSRSSSTKREFAKVATNTYNGGTGLRTLTFTENLDSAHTGDFVEPALRDNNADEDIATAARLDENRDNPPSGVRWVARGGDGRLWVATDTEIAVSNRPTPDRPYDFEVFADVDPITNRDPLQGWRFNPVADAPGDTIQWLGFFQGSPIILTTRALYRVTAQSQVVWGANSVYRLFDNLGCVSGDTVKEVNGRLVWAADRGRVVAWDGQGAPSVLSHQRVSATLSAAPRDKWDRWFSSTQVLDGAFVYSLWFVGDDADSFPKHRLDYNFDLSAWEEVAVYSSGGSRTAFQCAMTLSGPSDTGQMVVAQRYESGDTARGYVLLSDDEDALTDTVSALSVGVQTAYTTARFPLDVVGLIQEVALRLEGVSSDTATLTVTTGGSEAGDVTYTYPSLALTGTGDQWLRVQVNRELQGVWVELALTGTWSHAPELREVEVRYLPLRELRVAPCVSSGESA